MSDKRLIMYGRTSFCPDQGRAQRFLQANNVEYTQINIDEDETAGQRVEQWVGHRSVPTLVVAAAGEILPVEEPTALAPGRSARSVDRGSLITEPSDDALKAFLSRNGLL